MKTIYVCQIVDNLSESVTHTFMAASNSHAVSQFCSFLKSLPAKSVDPNDFELHVVGCVEISESYRDALSFAERDPERVYQAEEVYKEQKDESKS